MTKISINNYWASIYLTFFGEYWNKELVVEHIGFPRDSAGMLLKADIAGVQKDLLRRA